MEEKYVYVIYDPLYERIVCVHDEPEKTCELCDSIEKDDTYHLQEQKFIIQTKYK